MSIKVMSWVWENSPASGSGLLLLLAIADHADDDGTAYPSIQKLAKKTRMSRSSVFRAMKPLIESRQLKIESRGTGRDTSEYQIIMPPSRGVNLTPQGSQDDTPGVAERHPRGVNVDTPGVSLLTHRTVNEPSVVTTTTSSAPADAATGHRDEPPAPKIKPLARFDDFWKIYPLKKGKLAAQKAFTKAVTGGADPQAIIDGALEYAFECRMKEPKYVKYAQGWLNDGRWQDESAPTLTPLAPREIATCPIHQLPQPCIGCAADAKALRDEPLPAWSGPLDEPPF